MVRHSDKFDKRVIKAIREKYGVPVQDYVKGGKKVKGYSKSTPKNWSAEELDFIAANSKAGAKVLADALKRSLSSIYTKLSRLRKK